LCVFCFVLLLVVVDSSTTKSLFSTGSVPFQAENEVEVDMALGFAMNSHYTNSIQST